MTDEKTPYPRAEGRPEEPTPPTKRRLFRRRPKPEAVETPREVAPAEDAPAGQATAAADQPDEQAAAPAPLPTSRSAIKRRRARLAAERERAQFHLGGLAMEMVNRGALTRGVLANRAQQLLDLNEEIQLLDWRLQALELERRQRKGTAPAVAGSCLRCGADFAPESMFCWRCGTRFAPDTPSQAATTTEIGTVTGT